MLLFVALAAPCLAETIDNQSIVLPEISSSYSGINVPTKRFLPVSYMYVSSLLNEFNSLGQKTSSSHSRAKSFQPKVVPLESIQNHTYGEPPFMVQATSNSPGAITYCLVSGKATVTSAGLVTLTGIGTVTIEAIQAATPDFTSAIQTATFVVSPGTPSITFDVTDATTTSPFAVAASSTSTGAFTYSVVSGPAKIAGNMVSLTGTGQVVLQASEAADANYIAGSKTASFTAGASTLVVTANNASRLYGAQNPPFSGSITGSSPNDNLVETFATSANTASAVGTYSVVPAVSGPGLSNYTVDTIKGTLTITQAPTLTTLSASSTTINPSQTLVLTSQVISKTTGIPSGSVTFFDNGATLETLPLVNSIASLTTSLPAGMTHVITSNYSGDTNFLATMQGSGISITASPQDFAFAIQGSTTAVSEPGKTASYTFSVSPLFGSFGGTVAFSVLGLPKGASAVFTPSVLAPDAGPSTVQLSIQTSAQTVHRDRYPGPPVSGGGVSVAVVLLIFTSSRRLRQSFNGRILSFVVIGLGLSGTVFLSGCGSGILNQTSATYSLSAVANNGTIEHTETVTLAMQ